MAATLDGQLVVAISSRALFDFEEENQLFERGDDPVQAGYAVVVPAGATHNIINTGTESLKLYTLYAPPNHRDGVVHRTRVEAEADTEHFDGKTSE